MLNMTRRVFPKEEDDEPGAPSKAQMVFDQQVGKFDDFLKVGACQLKVRKNWFSKDAK